MKFLTKQEFQSLSESEKSTYYDRLMEERIASVTTQQIETLAGEFAKINYMDSVEIAKELLNELSALYKADEQYVKEKRKKGLAISLIIVCAAVLVATACIIINMF